MDIEEDYTSVKPSVFNTPAITRANSPPKESAKGNGAKKGTIPA